MLDSVRVRLTLWYSLVLALVLVILSVLTYLLYWHNISRRSDGDMMQLSDAFLTTLNAELADETGPDALKNAIQEAMAEHHFRNTYFAVLDHVGQAIESSLDLPEGGTTKESLSPDFLSPSVLGSLQADDLNASEFRTIHAGHDRYRAMARLFSAAGHSYTLVILQSLRPQREIMEDIRNTFLWAIPIALLFASFGGYFLARKTLAPIAAMAAQARGMGATKLNSRLMVTNPRDELGQLAQTFNQLLERLEASFEQQRRFMADASHELRTPVAILRGEAEVTLSRPQRSPEEYRQTLSILNDESRRLARIIEDLFTLARADAGQSLLMLRDAYLDEIAAEALVRARSLAFPKDINVVSKIDPDLPIRADEALLGRLLLNLLDNAVKYSPPGGTVTLTCQRDGANYNLSVCDNGPGIPKELQPRLFERFFRVDKVRPRSPGESAGAGLGLSIARWIAEAHHGKLVLTRSDESGSTFTATLPAA